MGTVLLEQMLVCAGGGPGALRVFGAGHPSLSDAWSLSAAADQVAEDDAFESESAAAAEAVGSTSDARLLELQAAAVGQTPKPLGIFGQ